MTGRITRSGIGNRLARRRAMRDAARQKVKKKMPQRPIMGSRGFKLQAKFSSQDEKTRMDAVGALVDFGESIGLAIGGSADFSTGEFDMWCERAGGDTTDADRERVLSFLVAHGSLFESVEMRPLSPSPYTQQAPAVPASSGPDAPPPDEEVPPPTA